MRLYFTLRGNSSAQSRHGAEFAAYFQKLKEYPGASGKIRFAANETIFDTEIIVVSGGKLVARNKN